MGSQKAHGKMLVFLTLIIMAIVVLGCREFKRVRKNYRELWRIVAEIKRIMK